jgi:hypothetical protein
MASVIEFMGPSKPSPPLVAPVFSSLALIVPNPGPHWFIQVMQKLLPWLGTTLRHCDLTLPSILLHRPLSTGRTGHAWLLCSCQQPSLSTAESQLHCLYPSHSSQTAFLGAFLASLAPAFSLAQISSLKHGFCPDERWTHLPAGSPPGRLSHEFLAPHLLPLRAIWTLHFDHLSTSLCPRALPQSVLLEDKDSKVLIQGHRMSTLLSWQGPSKRFINERLTTWFE